MFWHNFKYQLKILLRDHALVFWTLAFPLILGTFFNLAFSNIETSEQLATFDVAITEPQAQSDRVLTEALTTFNESSAEPLFRLHDVDRGEAERLLAEEEVVAIVDFDADGAKVTAHTSGVELTILKSVLEQINDQISTFGRPRTELTEVRNTSREHLSYTMVEFYTLIAMTCLYGGMLGMSAVNRLLANMSASGRRIAVSPASKLNLILSALAASFFIQCIGLVLLFGYTAGVLWVDYGEHYGLIVLLALVGSLCGLTFGMMIASVLHTNENTKIGMIISLTMFGCFLSGMMGITMKYIVDTNLPMLNRINPANLITDGFYALYYYGAAQRFWIDVASLAAITLVVSAVAVSGLRKDQYDNL